MNILKQGSTIWEMKQLRKFLPSKEQPIKEAIHSAWVLELTAGMRILIPLWTSYSVPQFPYLKVGHYSNSVFSIGWLRGLKELLHAKWLEACLAL